MRLTTLSLTLASCVSMVSADCNFGLVNQAKGARSNINNICSKAGPIQEKFIYDCRDGATLTVENNTGAMTLRAAKTSTILVKCGTKNVYYHCTADGVGNFDPPECGDASTVSIVYKVIES